MAPMRLDLIEGVLILSSHDRVIYGKNEKIKKESQDRIDFFNWSNSLLMTKNFLYRGHFL